MTVQNSAPSVSVALAPASPTTTTTLIATATPTDADGDVVSVTYTWRNGATVVRTTGPTTATTDSLDLSIAGNGNNGDTVSVDGHRRPTAARRAPTPSRHASSPMRCRA